MAEHNIPVSPAEPAVTGADQPTIGAFGDPGSRLLAEEVGHLLRSMPRRRPLGKQGVLGARADQARIAALRTAGPPVRDVRDIIVAGPGGPLPIRIYHPHGGPVAIIVYFHGGGWVMGSITDSDAHVRRITQATGCVLISVGYRLSPEHRFPAPLEDALAVWHWIVRERASLAPDGTPIGLAGDSAGGNIAAGAAIAIRDAGLPCPDFQILMYPVLSADTDTDSYRDYETGPVLTAADMRWLWDQYAPDPVARHDPRAVPCDADNLANLPPAFIGTAQCDPLHDEGAAYAARLADSGIPVEFRCYTGMIHGFYKMADQLAGGRAALADVAAFVRAIASSKLIQGGNAVCPKDI